MTKNYEEYTINDFLLDENFVLWTLEESGSKSNFWETFTEKFPEKKNDVKEAQKMLRTLTFTENTISEERISIISRNITQRIHEKQSKKSRIVPLTFYKIAASIALLVVLSFWVYNLISPKPVTIAIEEVYKSNPKGQKSVITLPDGSTVKLNAESRLTYPNRFVNNRELYLEGEAFFEVKEMPEKPFIVHSGKIKTTVLGTSFNFRNYPEENNIRVVLVTGKLLVSQKEKSPDIKNETILKPNEQILYNKVTSIINKDELDVQEIVGWKDNVIHFNQANLDYIERKLERWYGVDIDIQNESKKKIRLSTTFTNQSLENVLISLGFTLGFDYEIHEDYINISFK